MKSKRFLATFLSSLMMISSTVTPFLSLPVSATDNTFTGNGTSDIPISCEVQSGYKVILPAQVDLLKDAGTRYTKQFQTGVIGNIDSDKFVIVKPKDNSYLLSDQTNRRSVNANVTQADISWSANELGLGESIIEKDASTEAELNLAGSYSGEMQYEFFLSDEDISSTQKEGLQLSVSGTNVSEGENINIAMDSEISIEATMNGKTVDNSQINFESTNEHITVNEDGDIIISNKTIPGESATITASVDSEVAKADGILNYFSKIGILSNVCAASKTSVSFNVKVFDIHMDVNNISDVRILTVHPGDKVIIEANIEPVNENIDIMWTKTIIGGGLTKLSNSSVRLVVPEDIEIGSVFEVLANIGTYAKSIKIKVAHEYSENTIPATCTKKGSIIKTCSCGKEEYTEIPALGHSYGEYTVTKAATCTEDGAKARTCSVCNYVDTAVVTKLGHNYASTFTVDKAATCTEAGSKSKHCSRCDSKSEITSIPATGHAYGSVTYNWSDDKSTCTASRTCNTCSHVDTETVNTTNKVTTVATCTEAGVRTYTATFTNSAFKTQTATVAVSAVGHNYENGKCTICKETDPNFTSEAGLYDSNNNLLCTWEESGINIEKDYTSSTYKTSRTSSYYVITNKYPATTKVVIPDSVTSIGNFAFNSCSGLTSITIPNSVTGIGINTFGCTGLTSITIPDSVTSIGNFAFDNCKGLTSITIPDGVTSIGVYTFQYCTGLTSITIPDSVTSIGNFAFCKCTNLTSITIPENVTSIEKTAFYGCQNLTNATFKKTSGWYIGTSAGAKTTALSSSDLANTSTAASYLVSTYCYKYWTRN